MKNVFLLLAAAVLLLAIGAVVPNAVAATSLGGGEDPQAAPQPVSPADPKVTPPSAGVWVCPVCGAECSGPVWRHKGQLGRPQLGPLGKGRQWGRDGRPGRWGRDGDRRGAAAWDARPRFGGMGRGDFAGAGLRGGFAAEMVLRRADELKLTERQIESLEALARETQKKLVDLRADLQKTEIEIESLLRSESSDLAQIKRHLDAASKTRADIREARIAHLFEVRKVLTPEQKKVLKEEFPRLGSFLD